MNDNREYEKLMLKDFAKHYRYIAKESDSCLIAYKTRPSPLKAMKWFTDEYRYVIPHGLCKDGKLFEDMKTDTIYRIDYLLEKYDHQKERER